MKNIIDILIARFQESIYSTFPELLPLDEITAELTQSTQEKFGHYQCNTAMKLARILKQNPRKIAKKIVEEVGKESDDKSKNNIIGKLEIAGPGFINITLKKEFLEERLETVIKDPRLGIALPENPQRIIVEFSSPNIAKEMHVGHLRSTVIGDSLARLFEFLGEDVVRLNHIGDWGTAFGMLIAYIKKEEKDLSKNNLPDISELLSWYKLSKKNFDENSEFKKASQLSVVALQAGEQEAMDLWHLICEISRKAYQEIYDLLSISIKERGESFYNPWLLEVVEDLEKKGLIADSDGAKCIFMDGFKGRDDAPLPMIVQKADGGFNYSTTDLASIRYRVREDKAKRLIYVIDSGQSLHLKMAFKAAELAGYANPKEVKIDHVGFGLVLGADGKKFRTRSGETEKLIDLIQTAIKRSEEILKERYPDLDSEERKKRAQALGVGAIKYADLSCNRVGDYTFSYDRMLRFEGNTAAFLMYAYVRVNGIKRKVGTDIVELIKKEKVSLQHPSELALALHLLQFGEALQQAAKELLPNRISDYLYNLAEKFNAFFRDCRVEGDSLQNPRLLLCEAVARVMRQGLTILGVPIVEQM